jgi:hypothetical protein
MHNVENKTGRLVEVRLASPLTPDEVQQFARELQAIIGRIPSKYIGVVDLREAHVFPPAVADALIQLLSAASPRVERTAMLIGESATFALQVERVIRSASNENRRAFRNPAELKSWLDEVATAEERLALKQFLAAAPATSRGAR